MRTSIFLLLTFLIACTSSTPFQQKTLKINLGSEPQTLDPRKARDLNAVTLMHMLFEGLMRISKEGSPELALAEKVELSSDGLTYTFHLRPSSWTNKRPVTSFDFAASFQKTLDPLFPSNLAYQLYAIKGAKSAKLGQIPVEKIGVHTPDAHTLVIELAQPISYFLELLTFPAFFPICSDIEQVHPNWSEDLATYVSNGPFSLKAWRHSDCIDLEKNPLYWDAESVCLEQIEFMMVSAETELRMFCDGQLDWAGSPLSELPVDAFTSLKQNKALKISPFAATFFLRVNTAKENSPLHSCDFRKALASAVDREGIVEHILQGGQLPAYTLVPPCMSGVGAVKKFVAAKIADSAPLSILYVANERNHLVMQAIQQQIEKTLQIPIRLEAAERRTYYDRIANREYDLALGSWVADFNDPINFLEIFKSNHSSTNNTGWEDPKYVEWLNRSNVCRNVQERRELLLQAEELLMDQMPVIPIYHCALNYLQKQGVEDIYLSPIGQIDFRWCHK